MSPGRSPFSRLLKRALDVAGASIGLVVLSPMLALVAAALRVSVGPPILFRQQRPGLQGRPFTLVKFRTMSDACDDGGRLLPDDERLTRVGRWVRATSFDEAPQLWNVLVGEMSLVGPRPLLMQYLSRYSAEQARRHEMRPGITGWAQVNGRNTLSWKSKFERDVWYIDHWSLALDARILFKTVLLVLRRKGISYEGHATMPEFTGRE
jgi:lipopolysaccharide/colanic/teichoic acid biosynthesis glycosyltransferase